MRILLDTNILIRREDNVVIAQDIANLMRIIEILHYEKCIHPLSISEIKKDKNSSRRKISLSKLSSYPILENVPNYQDDYDFSTKLPLAKSSHDIIDNQLLYCVSENIVSYFITEDKALLAKADLIGIESVFSINEAIDFFNQSIPNPDINLLQSFMVEKGWNINVNDEIFDTLKQSYPQFIEIWWKPKVISENRDVYICKNNATAKINAILIPKIEEGNDHSTCFPALPKEKLIKICLFKVQAKGLRLGERLLSMAFDYAQKNNINKLYLTHYREENDYLIRLIEKYGFKKYGEKSDGEEIYFKEIVLSLECINPQSRNDIMDLNKRYYPSFYDGNKVKKYIVPILPLFHKKLFPDYKGENTQLSFPLTDCPEGNSIKKAYICNSNTKKLQQGDILLFYQSKERMAITTIGTVEAVYTNQKNAETIMKLIAKRTVFNIQEVEILCNSDVLVILFNQNFHLKKEITLLDLNHYKIDSNLITIREIKDEQYKQIIEGNINECFTIH